MFLSQQKFNTDQLWIMITNQALESMYLKRTASGVSAY